jgi:hypothetical protein
LARSLGSQSVALSVKQAGSDNRARRVQARRGRSATGVFYEKPVGTLFIALAAVNAVAVEKRLNPWDRLTFKMSPPRKPWNCCVEDW